MDNTHAECLLPRYVDRESETDVNIFHANEAPYTIFSPNMILGIVAK